MEALAIFGKYESIKPTMFPEEINDVKSRLNRLKEFYGVSVNQIAAGIGENPSKIKNYFDANTKTEPPGYIVVKCAKFFNVPTEEIEEKYKGMEHLVDTSAVRDVKNKNIQKTKNENNKNKNVINIGKPPKK